MQFKNIIKVSLKLMSFPQNARWKITRKGTMVPVQDWRAITKLYQHSLWLFFGVCLSRATRQKEATDEREEDLRQLTAYYRPACPPSRF
jgi:hypothetical protein